MEKTRTKTKKLSKFSTGRAISLFFLSVLGVFGIATIVVGVSNPLPVQAASEYCVFQIQNIKNERDTLIKASTSEQEKLALVVRYTFILRTRGGICKMQVDTTVPPSLFSMGSTGTSVTTSVESTTVAGSGFFQIVNPEFLQSLSGELKTSTEQLTETYKTEFLTALQSLQKNGLIQSGDILRIRGKVSLEYFHDCKEIRGTTLIRQRFDGNNVFIRNEFMGINLKVNICSNSYIIEDVKRQLPFLMTHELSHYYYYMKDNTKQGFTNLCWSQQQDQTFISNNTCQNTDFVSEYAMMSAEEDYAETFANVYLKKPLDTSSSVILTQKKNYFSNIFGQ